jgi:OmpA-OmpF porin, OOP family
MKKSLILFLFISINIISFAQNFEAGLFVGGASYSGDIDVRPKNVLPQMRMAVGVFGRYPFNSSWALKAQLTHSQLYGNEKLYATSSYRAERGFSFKTQLTEVSAQMEWHYLKLDKSFYIEDNDPAISLYGFGGLGVSFFDPKTNFNEPNTIVDDVSLDKEAVYNRTTVVLPLGIGAKVRVGESLMLGLEGGIRVPFTDYLDGISRLIAAKFRDYYFFTGVTLSFEFNGGGGGGYSGGNWQRR